MRLNKNILVLVMLIFASCKSQNLGSHAGDKLDDKMARKLGSNMTKTKNFEGNYTLAWAEDRKSGTPLLRYGVWESETNELIYAGTALRGKVEWLDNNSLLVEEYPGIVEHGKQNYKFKIDLNSKVKSPLYEAENK